MKKQEKCVEAVLKSAIVVDYEVDRDKKLAWALEFDNGIRLISKNHLVEVGAPYRIKYTVFEDGTITDISAVPITKE